MYRVFATVRLCKRLKIVIYLFFKSYEITFTFILQMGRLRVREVKNLESFIQYMAGPALDSSATVQDLWCLTLLWAFLLEESMVRLGTSSIAPYYTEFEGEAWS